MDTALTQDMDECTSMMLMLVEKIANASGHERGDLMDEYNHWHFEHTMLLHVQMGQQSVLNGTNPHPKLKPGYVYPKAPIGWEISGLLALVHAGMGWEIVVVRSSDKHIRVIDCESPWEEPFLVRGNDWVKVGFRCYEFDPSWL